MADFGVKTGRIFYCDEDGQYITEDEFNARKDDLDVHLWVEYQAEDGLQYVCVELDYWLIAEEFGPLPGESEDDFQKRVPTTD
jgi:hypothetical protein